MQNCHSLEHFLNPLRFCFLAVVSLAQISYKNLTGLDISYVISSLPPFVLGGWQAEPAGANSEVLPSPCTCPPGEAPIFTAWVAPLELRIFTPIFCMGQLAPGREFYFQPNGCLTHSHISIFHSQTRRSPPEECPPPYPRPQEWGWGGKAKNTIAPLQVVISKLLQWLCVPEGWYGEIYSSIIDSDYGRSWRTQKDRGGAGRDGNEWENRPWSE